MAAGTAFCWLVFSCPQKMSPERTTAATSHTAVSGRKGKLEDFRPLEDFFPLEAVERDGRLAPLEGEAFRLRPALLFRVFLVSLAGGMGSIGMRCSVKEKKSFHRLISPNPVKTCKAI